MEMIFIHHCTQRKTLKIQVWDEKSKLIKEKQHVTDAKYIALLASSSFGQTNTSITIYAYIYVQNLRASDFWNLNFYILEYSFTSIFESVYEIVPYTFSIRILCFTS